MKPWLSEQGVFNGGDKDAALQDDSPKESHGTPIVQESENGDVIMTGNDESSKK